MRCVLRPSPPRAAVSQPHFLQGGTLPPGRVQGHQLHLQGSSTYWTLILGLDRAMFLGDSRAVLVPQEHQETVAEKLWSGTGVYPLAASSVRRRAAAAVVATAVVAAAAAADDDDEAHAASGFEPRPPIVSAYDGGASTSSYVITCACGGLRHHPHHHYHE